MRTFGMMQTWILVVATALLWIFPSFTNAFVTERVQKMFCQSESLARMQCRLPQSQLKLISITVYFAKDTSRLKHGNCGLDENQFCKRLMHETPDSALPADLIGLHEWVRHKCDGMQKCNGTGQLPLWWQLTNRVTQGSDCDDDGIKYFAKTFLDFKCFENEDIETAAPPELTTPRTTPTTPPTTTPFSITFMIYKPHLGDREKILLGIAVGLSIAILLVLLTILYCCDRWRRNKKFTALLRKIGKPQAMHDNTEDFTEYGVPAAWKTEIDNGGDLREYTGVKPDEFLTIDRSGQTITDYSSSSMGRNTTTSTAARYNTNTPLIKPGNGHHDGPVNYDTEENIELERRMAGALGQ